MQNFMSFSKMYGFMAKKWKSRQLYTKKENVIIGVETILNYLVGTKKEKEGETMCMTLKMQSKNILHSARMPNSDHFLKKNSGWTL